MRRIEKGFETFRADRVDGTSVDRTQVAGPIPFDQSILFLFLSLSRKREYDNKRKEKDMRGD